MKKAFGYLRVSGQGQVNGDGFDRQEKAVKDYAKANGFEVVQIFREEGVSGSDADRPTLARLMVSLEQNGHQVKTVIIEKLDRLARDLMVQEAIIRDFRKQGFDLISTLEPELCSDDPTRKLMRQMMGAIAEYEKSMIVLKLKAARERKRIRYGKCEGRKGYKDYEEGKHLLTKIRALRRATKDGERRTFAEVAEELNRQGIKTMTGKDWTGPWVRKVLK